MQPPMRRLTVCLSLVATTIGFSPIHDPRISHLRLRTLITKSESPAEAAAPSEKQVKPKRAPVWTKGNPAASAPRSGGGARAPRRHQEPPLLLQKPQIIVRIEQARDPRPDRSVSGGRPVIGGGDSRGSGAGFEVEQPRFSPDRKSFVSPDKKKGGAGAPLGRKKSEGEGKFGGKRTSSRRTQFASKGSSGRGSLKSRRRGKKPSAAEMARKVATRDAAVKRLTLDNSPIQVQELANRLSETGAAVVKYLMMDLGVMATMTMSIDAPTAKLVAGAFGQLVLGEGEEWKGLQAYHKARGLNVEVVEDDEDEDEDDEDLDEGESDESVVEAGAGMIWDDPALLVRRPPVVTIMGHVDHGKTSLLDAIRGTQVVDGEAGGITQAIAAYQVHVSGDGSTRGDNASGEKEQQLVTFVDTPGHAAFSAMRQRGADVTDIVVLVVAADDGVKEQTVQSLTAARQAGKSIVVALTKVDKEGANVNRVMSELTAYGVLLEALGGDVLSAEVSAKRGEGLDDLLAKVLLQAEVLDLKANYVSPASGTVIEAQVKRGRGTVATVLVQRGTLKVGDEFILGERSGKVRTLTNDRGECLRECGPSTPVQVTGVIGVPLAGDLLFVGEDRSILRSLAETRAKIAREKAADAFGVEMSKANVLSLSGEVQKELKEINVLVKADVIGAAEALSSSLRALAAEDELGLVRVKVLSASVGDVTKSDVALAGVSNAFIIGFNVAADFQAMEDARIHGLEIGYHSIVYDVLEEIEKRMNKVLSPTPDGYLSGKAEVKAIFDIGKVGKIAGCIVTEGNLAKVAAVRVMRGPRIVYEGSLRTLKSFKENVVSVESGNECGANFVDWEEMLEGDVVECYSDLR